jgi:hexosaminidase
MGYIDLMLSVDSHYLNDPLPRTLFFLGRKGANTEGGCYVERTCGEHIQKKIWPQNCRNCRKIMVK